MRDLVEQSVHERHPDGALAWLNSLPDSVFVRLDEKLLPRDQQPELVSHGYQIKVINFADLQAKAPDDGEARAPGLT